MQVILRELDALSKKVEQLESGGQKGQRSVKPYSFSFDEPSLKLSQFLSSLDFHIRRWSTLKFFEHCFREIED
jgi:hypothetical protein